MDETGKQPEDLDGQPAYAAPKLTLYGAMTQLTAGGSGKMSEFSAMNMSKKKRS